MSMLLALLLLAALLPLGASAAVDGLALEAGEVTALATAGTTVRVPIKATANSGYGSGILTVSWNKAVLELKDVEYSALAPKGYSAEIKNTGKYIIDFGDDLATKDFTGTGTFFTLVFQVKAGAMTGDYPITLTDFDVNDNYIDPVTVTGKAGKVKLVATLPATVTGALSGGSLKYTVTNAPEGARLVAARYDGGRMTASKVFTGALASGSVTLGSAGSCYKLMLIDSAGRPLCKAWCSE